MKLIVIGGGAGGTGAAARFRRLNEKADITIFERSGYASYSNCGLPYKFSDEIAKFEDLIMTTPEELKFQYNLDVKVKHEVMSIDKVAKTVTVKDLSTDKTSVHKFDKLIIAAGAPAIKPPIPGLAEAKNVFTLKTPDDVWAAEQFIKKSKPKSVAVIGGGFIGAEIAENFKRSGYEVSIIDMAPYLLPNSLDADFAAWIHQSIKNHGINLYLKEQVASIEKASVKTASGKEIAADMVFLTIGVRPELKMYQEIGLKIGKTGGIIVNNKQQTNVKDIFAVGDIAETINWRGETARIALAFPASRQGVVAANTASEYVGPDGKADTYKGVTGASTLTMFETTVASVGYTEKYLIDNNIKYNKTLNARGANIGPVQGGGNVFVKVLYDDKFQILGAQAAGPETTEKRISYISFAMQNKIPFTKFEDFMVAYSPTVDTTYDATTMGARLARHQAEGSLKSIFASELETYRNDGWTLIDVREPYEWAKGTIKGAETISLSTFRENIKKLDKKGKYILNCKTGARSYNAGLILKANGFKNVLNLAGGYDFHFVWSKFANVSNEAAKPAAKATTVKAAAKPTAKKPVAKKAVVAKTPAKKTAAKKPVAKKATK